MYKKVTKQNVKEMKKLRKQGWFYKDIAQKLKINETTVGLYCRNKKGICHKRDGIGDNPEEIPLFIRQNIEAQKLKVYDKDKCQIYGGNKEWKWRFTHICGIKCYEGLTTSM